MDFEGDPPRRLVAAGAALVGGLFFGGLVSVTFGWYPYSWQWLAYHNGLVALVSIYLVVPASGSGPMLEDMSDEVPAPARSRIPPLRGTSDPRASGGTMVVVRRLGETWVSDRIALPWPEGWQDEKGELRASRMTAWSSNGKGFERTAAVLYQNRRGRRFAKQSRQ